MTSLFPRLRRLAGPAPLLVGLLMGVVAPVSVAVASEPPAPLVLDLQDPEGDAAGRIGIDLLAATVSQDRVTGVFKADLTFTSDPSTVNVYMHVALGFRRGGNCMTAEGQPGVAHLLSKSTAPDATYAISARTKVGGKATKVVSGRQVTITSDPDPLLTASTWSCVRVELLGVSDEDEPILPTVYDEAVGFPPLPAPKSPGQVAPAPLAGDVTVLDADGDAVPDSTDQCRDVPGAKTDGCPTVDEADSLRLEAKRLVVDRLIPRTGKACPAAVKLTVTAKRRVIGKQRIGVIQHGAFCHVAGAVKLKSRAKTVRVAVTGTGIRPVRAVVGT